MKKFFFIGSLVIIFTLPLWAENYFYEQGRLFFINKKYETAKEMFLKSTTNQDNNGDPYYFLGEIEKKQANYLEAEKYFKLALEKETITKEYKKNSYWNLIVLAEQNGQYRQLIKFCRKMWEDLDDWSAHRKAEKTINRFLWSTNSEAIEAYQQGMSFTLLEKYEEAKKMFLKATSLDSRFLAPKFELGWEAYQHQNFEEAVQYFSEIIYEIPFYAEIHLLLGNIFLGKKYFNIAGEHFRQALEYGFWGEETKAEVYLNLGITFYNQGKYILAQDYTKEALNFKKDKIDPLILLASILEKQDKEEEALGLLEEAKIKYKDLNENDLSLLFQLGKLNYKLKFKDYFFYFSKLGNIIKRRPSSFIPEYSKAFIILIQDYFKKQQYQEVLSLGEILPEKILTYELYLILAKSNFYEKKFQKTTEIFEKLSLDNLDPSDHLLLCQAYLKTKNLKAAQTILKPFLDKDENPEFQKIINQDEELKNLWDSLLQEETPQKNSESPLQIDNETVPEIEKEALQKEENQPKPVKGEKEKKEQEEEIKKRIKIETEIEKKEEKTL